MPTVPFNSEEIADEKRETTGEFSLLTTENFGLTTVSSKPEAIVRPLRRREPSDDENNRPPDLQDLEAQIIDKLTQLEKPQKAQNREFDKKPQNRWNYSRDSKKSSKDVSYRHLVLNDMKKSLAPKLSPYVKLTRVGK